MAMMCFKAVKVLTLAWHDTTGRESTQQKANISALAPQLVYPIVQSSYKIRTTTI